MKTSDFDYKLPMERIAQKPAEPRDRSKLMIVKRKKTLFDYGRVKHKKFFDIAEYLQAGDLLVWNNSKVFKARLFGELLSKEGQQLFEHKKKILEIFLVRPMQNPGVWQVLAKPGKHVSHGAKIRFAPGFVCEILLKEPKDKAQANKKRR